MSKQYGLILPGKQRKIQEGEVACVLPKPSIFGESSSDSDECGPPQRQINKTPIGPSLLERRKAKNLQEKALTEDPTIFQYDELYDDIKYNREEILNKNKEPKKARYITKLIDAAEKRKLENELRVERQVQKEREAEGAEFKDKEAFVTPAYRKKLEEMRKLDEQNKREDYLEAIGDVTKQKDLDGFYRHIYEQKTGTRKDDKKTESTPDIVDAVVAYKSIVSGRIQKQRSYRKRASSDEEKGRDQPMKELQNKKLHLSNNIDADSDFSIDETSAESESEADQYKNRIQPINNMKSNSVKLDGSNIINLASLKPEERTENKSDISIMDPKLDMEVEKMIPTKTKRDKTEIWRKRTVGDVYEAALQRYYERKTARNRA